MMRLANQKPRRGVPRRGGESRSCSRWRGWLWCGGLAEVADDAGGWPGVGETDELGYATVKDTVNVRDLHATLLHQFGIDHSRFSTKFQGLDYRLTGVEPAKPVQAIMV